MAQEIDFTIRTIKAVVPPSEGRVEYRCSSQPGLVLRVTSGGVKTFSYMGRARGSRRLERTTIGSFPIIKPEEAIERARSIAAMLARGESEAEALRAKRRELSLTDLFEKYLASLKGKRPDYLEGVWRRDLHPRWGRRKLSEISHEAVATWHRSLPEQITERRAAASQSTGSRSPQAQKPAGHVTGTRAANQALQLMHTLYRWAIEAARLYSGDNPAHGIKKYKEESRDRFLQPHEMRAFFTALASEPNLEMRDFVMLALLTGARRTNILEMRWGELDLLRGEWRIPDTKNGRPQVVTLVPEAVTLLRERHASAKQSGAPGDWVLPARSASGHLAEPKSGMKRLLEKSGIADLRIHDLRRTLGSWQARTGASLTIIGKTLNHQSSASTAIYARLDLDPVRRATETATAAMFQAATLVPPPA